MFCDTKQVTRNVASGKTVFRIGSNDEPVCKGAGYKKKQGVSILFKVKKEHEVKRSDIGWS